MCRSRKRSFFSTFRRGVGGWLGLLLAAVLVRGVTPAGYMPAVGEPFEFELCRAGWPAGVLAESDGGAPMPSGDGGVDCSFGWAPGAAPVSQVVAVLIAPAAVPALPESDGLSFVVARRDRASQPRAPPALS